MLVASNHYTRSQVHRSPQILRSISHTNDLAFMDQQWYYETDDSLSQITASTSRSRRNESESVSSMSQLENAFEDDQQTLLQFVKSYSLHIIVAAIVYMFLFEVTVRIPFLLALTFAIPSIHMLPTPVKSISQDVAHEHDPEALYRRSSINPAVPGEPVTQYKTAGASHSVAVTFSGLTLFSPSTWFPRATDPIDFRFKRQRLHTTFRESTYQPRRTFREAFEDTVPRVLESWTMFILRTIFYQITSRIIMFIIGRTYEVTTGEEMNVNVYIMNVLRFYLDWAVGMSCAVWYVMKGLVRVSTVFLGQLLLRLGEQLTMAVGAMHDTRLEYGDPNTLQL